MSLKSKLICKFYFSNKLERCVVRVYDSLKEVCDTLNKLSDIK